MILTPYGPRPREDAVNEAAHQIIAVLELSARWGDGQRQRTKADSDRDADSDPDGHGCAWAEGGDMKTIDLSKGDHSLSEVLTLAKTDAVLIHCASGDDFLLEQADKLDREAAVLGSSERFMSFLSERSREEGSLSLAEMRKKRGI